MRISFFLIVMLGLSMACFAESGDEQLKPSSAINQPESITGENEQPARIKAEKKKIESQFTQKNGINKRSLMIDYCRKHTC
ncbi:hypothetical protein [Nitrosomonas sp.]|uniref:hypothetical protein n=1 Tax=Nitrosomonas sp. TaxID=42353 RepID=UPI0025D9063E|nr:hypothetical protein [Nitrosomonas sp.]